MGDHSYLVSLLGQYERTQELRVAYRASFHISVIIYPYSFLLVEIVIRTTTLIICMVCGLWLLQGCSPNLGPLYRDYEVDKVDVDIYDRILSALDATGWDTTTASAPNSIKTEGRIMNRWLIYRTVASLEIIPIGDDYVRVLIHPYRHNFLRMRSKLPYLPSNIERKIVPQLTAALADEGVYIPGRVPADSTIAGN